MIVILVYRCKIVLSVILFTGHENTRSLQNSFCLTELYLSILVMLLKFAANSFESLERIVPCRYPDRVNELFAMHEAKEYAFYE